MTTSVVTSAEVAAPLVFEAISVEPEAAFMTPRDISVVDGGHDGRRRLRSAIATTATVPAATTALMR